MVTGTAVPVEEYVRRRRKNARNTHERDSGIWVADPYRKSLYSHGSNSLRLVNPPVLENELTGAIDFAAIFAELDRSGKRG